MSDDHSIKVKPISVNAAKQRLEEVKKILDKIEPVYKKYVEKREQLEDRSKTEDPQEISKLRYKVDQIQEKLQAMRQELLEIDCVLKDYKTGIVDFVSIRHGKPVWLCFKHGESELKFYHSWSAGFAGRQPIDFV